MPLALASTIFQLNNIYLHIRQKNRETSQISGGGGDGNWLASLPIYYIAELMPEISEGFQGVWWGPLPKF